MAYETIVYEKKNHVAYVVQNRPDALNALSYKMSDEIMAAFEQADSDDDVYVIVLTGAGRAFNVGADQKEASRAEPPQGSREKYGGYKAPGRASKPVLGAVNGICAGGGLMLIGGCDVVICSHDATFFDPHADVGWLPLYETLATATYMPFGIAMRMALMGSSERMPAERAYQLGLVSEVVPRDKLMERTTEIAETIASKAPLVTRWIRQTMRQIIITAPHATPLAEAERWVHLQVNRSPDGLEGPRSFAEKRKPQWTGEGGPIDRQRRKDGIKSRARE